MVDLRNAHGDGPRLIENDGVDIGQVFDVVAAFDENPFPGGNADGCRNGRCRRQFQAAREVDEQEVEYPLPILSRPIDDGRADKGNRNQEVGHLISKILNRRPTGLGFFDEVNDLGQGRIGTDFFDSDDEIPRFNDAAGIDR